MITGKQLLYVATWFITLGVVVATWSLPPTAAMSLSLIVIGFGILFTAIIWFAEAE